MPLNIQSLKKVQKGFYQQPVLKASPKLLGKLFVKNDNGIIIAGMITEVEAYDGSIDQAAHTFSGKTERNKVMFNEGGFLYVYFTYGMYYCCNVVFGEKESGEAALIRSIEPVAGIDVMQKNRFSQKTGNLNNLTTGPAKICMAYDIDKKYNGTNLCGDRISLYQYKDCSENEIAASERIGITKSKELKWRFYIKDNPFISRK